MTESTQELERKPTRFGLPAPGQALEGPLLAWLLIAPGLLLLLTIILYPVVNTIIISFHSYNSLITLKSNHWIGLQNYRQALTNSVYGFWTSVEWSVIFAVLTTVFAFLLGLAMALVLNEHLRFRTLWRGMALVPWVIPYVVVAYLFFYMFNSQYGIINEVLTSIHIFGWHPIPDPLAWYGKGSLARIAVITAAVWNRFPFFTLMLLAGMQTLPQDLYDAAKVDGANSRDRFRAVTFPGLRGIIAIVTTLSLIWSFNEFAIIWAMTNGGPGVATDNMVIHIYRTGFLEQRLSMAATMSAIWLVILMGFAYFYIRIMEGKAGVE